jgi:hypothetical protein
MMVRSQTRTKKKPPTFQHLPASKGVLSLLIAPFTRAYSVITSEKAEKDLGGHKKNQKEVEGGETQRRTGW